MDMGLWQSISEYAKDLVKRLLEPNPDLRLTAEEALLHPWIKVCCPYLHSYLLLFNATLSIYYLSKV